MSTLPLESVQEWMSFLNRETVDACFSLSRKFYVASSSMKALRFVDTATLREYETMRNYNVTIAWTTVVRSRRGKPKEEKKALQINSDNAIEAIQLFASALRFCVVKEPIELNMRSLLLHRTDIEQLSEIMQELRVKGARIHVGDVQFRHLDDYHAASALLSIMDARQYSFESSALSMGLLEWADANDAYRTLSRIDLNRCSLTEEMILYLCFGGRSTKAFSKCLSDPPVSPQFLRKLIKARRDASTRREVRLTMDLPPGRLEVEPLRDQEMRRIVYSNGLSIYTFVPVDIEDFKLEYWVPKHGEATLYVTAN